MVRILVLMEDYAELTQTRSLLKRVGCDVDAANSEVGFKEKILSLKPDVLVVSGIGKKINPVNISKKLSEISGINCKIILILAPGVRISLNDLAENKFEAFLESPFDPMRLMKLISKFSNGKANDLEERFQKLAIEGGLGQEFDVSADKRIIKGNFASSTSANYASSPQNELKDRIAKYSQLVEGMSISKVSTISNFRFQKKSD
jgi:DNA-binding NtrC family response regulator